MIIPQKTEPKQISSFSNQTFLHFKITTDTKKYKKILENEMGIFSPCCVAQEIFIFTLKYEKKEERQGNRSRTTVYQNERNVSDKKNH